MTKVELGSYVVGEVPSPLEYQFLDSAGAPIDLTGYTATFDWALRGAGVPFEAWTSDTASVTDAAGGVVTHVWDGDEFAEPGTHVGVFWVDNGTNRFASVYVEWDVCRAPVPTA